MARGDAKTKQPDAVPTATISRMVTYLRILSELENAGVKNISSDSLADAAQVSAFQIRKDLAYFGRFGTRGAGYSVPVLHRELNRILGLNREWNVAIVGMGRLGQAIAHYPNFNQYHFALKSFFDISPKVIGETINGITVHAMSELPRLVKEKQIELGLLTVPHDAAQDAADALVAAGIRGILNFAPRIITVPREIHVEPVDFLAGLKRLSFYSVNPQLKEELL
jgi:redox-sensing transcriptional repressor